VSSGVERAFPEELPVDVREHAWGDGTGVRCAGARSRKAPVLEAAAHCAGLSAEARGTEWGVPPEARTGIWCVFL
jgi:hypothetical protein